MFIVEREPKSIEAEAYRVLRTNIEYSSYNGELKVIVVTSGKADEGKSTTAGNLAISLANDKQKVLLIDLDLRRASLHKKFSISNQVGFTEVVLGKKDLFECVQCKSEYLDILTSGKLPPNPSEMLGSKVVEDLLEGLKEQYDYILLDLPPLLAVTDAQIISSKADGVIFVAKYGSTKKDEIMQAKKLLDKVKANIIGTVLTRVKKEAGSYSYYYYGDDNSRKGKRKNSKH